MLSMGYKQVEEASVATVSSILHVGLPGSLVIYSPWNEQNLSLHAQQIEMCLSESESIALVI